MRRIAAFVLVLALVCPVAVMAGGPAGDPSGSPTTGDVAGTDWSPWLDSVFRVLLAQLGI